MGRLSGKGITRRGFLLGGIAAGAGTAAALAGCSSKTGSSDDAAGEPQVVKDNSKIVSVVDDYEAVDDIKMEAASTWTLPLGTVLAYDEGDYAAAMLAPASAKHANTLGVLSLGDGSLTTLVEDPKMGSACGFYEMRCGESVFAWVEMDYATSKWTLWAQPFSGGALSGAAQKLDRGGADYDPPMFTVMGSSVIWYKMPSTSGKKTSADSLCYIAEPGGKAETIWKSTGRFACAPRVSDGILTITPRVRNDEGVYYGMTAVDLTDGNFSRRAQLVLPTSVSPFEAVYMGEKFAFSIEASYDGVGSLGNMGTYIGTEGGPYVYLAREPLACAAGKGNRYLVKSQASHFLINTHAKTYGTLLSPDRSLDYGDYPASAGSVDSFVTYATVRNAQGVPESVTARLFSL